MSRHVDTGSTDQTIVFWAFDSDGVAVEVTTSDSVSYRRDNNGREGTPVSLTLVARTVAGTHRDSAITYKGDGKHEVDLPDAAVATAGELTLEVTKSGVASVYVEKLEVSAAEVGLTGPYTRTITVTDSDTSAAIEGAKVRFYRTGETGTTVTNASGVASFTVEAATWSYAITANGYTGISGTIVVSANGDTAVQMDLTTLPAPSDPDNSVLTITCRDAGGTAQQGITVQVRMTVIPTGDENNAFSEAVLEDTSDSNGQVSFEVVQGGTYEWRRGSDADWSTIVIDSDSSTDVESIIGCQY